MAPRADEFVNAVMAHLGVDTPTDLVRAMEWGVNDASTVSRWAAGKTTPSYARTMDMLERCGWLNTSAAPTRKAHPVQDAAPIPERRLEEVVDLVVRGFRALGVSPEALRVPEDPPDRTEESR